MFGRQVAAVVMAGMLGLTGCAGDGRTDAAGAGGAEPTEVAVGTSPGTATSPGRSPVPVTGPDQVLVTMLVTGGFAGVHQEVSLRGDGSVHTSDKGERAVRRTGAAEFTELRTLLGDPALADVSDVTINMQAADMFQYTLRFDSRTVMTDRSTPDPALDPLIDALSEWLPRR